MSTTTPRSSRLPLFDSEKSRVIGDEYAISLAIETLWDELSDTKIKKKVGQDLYNASVNPNGHVIERLERQGFGVRPVIDKDISEISIAFSKRLAEILRLLQSAS